MSWIDAASWAAPQSGSFGDPHSIMAFIVHNIRIHRIQRNPTSDNYGSFIEQNIGLGSQPIWESFPAQYWYLCGGEQAGRQCGGWRWRDLSLVAGGLFITPGEQCSSAGGRHSTPDQGSVPDTPQPHTQPRGCSQPYHLNMLSDRWMFFDLFEAAGSKPTSIYIQWTIEKITDILRRTRGNWWGKRTLASFIGESGGHWSLYE